MAFEKSFCIFLLCLALLSGMAFADVGALAQQTQASFEAKLAPNTGDWYQAALIAILLGVFLNGLIYMIGIGFNLENLKRYARGEFLQVAASALMIFFAVELIYGLSSGGGAFSIMSSILGTSASIPCSAAPSNSFNLWDQNSQFGTGPIGAFKCETQAKINKAESDYSNQFNINLGEEALASICVSVFGFPIWCWDWLNAVHKTVEMAHLLADKLVSLLITLNAQYAAADYIQNNMLGVFLPLGLVLRILPYTRGVGGLLIAIAVGFYFVWPTFTVLTAPGTTAVSNPLQNLAQPPTAANGGIGCFTGFSGAASLISQYSNSAGAFGATEAMNAQIEIDTQDVFIQALFYPFAAFVVTLAFIRAVTPLLGGDLGELMRAVARIG